jgi:hypothetical protein
VRGDCRGGLCFECAFVEGTETALIKKKTFHFEMSSFSDFSRGRNKRIEINAQRYKESEGNMAAFGEYRISCAHDFRFRKNLKQTSFIEICCKVTWFHRSREVRHSCVSSP